MLFVLAASGLALVTLPGLARGWGRRLPAQEWAALCAAAVFAGAVVVEAAAALYAAPTLTEASGVAALGELCQRMLGSLAPGGPVAGWVAAVVAVALPVLGGRGWVRARQTSSEAWIDPDLGRHQPWGDHELVVLPTPQLLAVSLPAPGGGPGQIAVSDGLLDTLTPGQLDAVLHHEAAHLHHRHHLHLAGAAAVEHALAWFAPARHSTATLRLALERWADEDAAACHGGRPAVRSALLAVTTSLVAGADIAAFSAAETLGERLDALDATPPQPSLARHLLLYCPGIALGAVVLVALSSWASGLEAVLAMAGQCA